MNEQTEQQATEGLASPDQQRLVMPLQPIKDGRFVPNRIVEKLLEAAPIGLNELACMEFTDQERVQFAQLIGYSVGGFGSLDYVDDETYNAAELVCSQGCTELEARLQTVSDQLNEVRKGLKDAAAAAFRVHPDDLKV